MKQKLWGLLFCLCLLPRLAVGETTLFCINVGKADAMLLFVAERIYLIDTGTKKQGDTVVQALSDLSVSHLDGIFITHTDKDHVGGLSKVLESGVKVNALYASVYHDASSMAKHPVKKAAKKYNVPLLWLKAGDVIALPNDQRIAVLGPLRAYPDNNNNQSLVLQVDTADGRILLTGDMEEEAETDLLRAGLLPKVDVLKVGHHGGKDATQTKFVLATMPRLAIISTSTAEKPETPNESVVRRLKSAGATVFVTQEATLGINVTLKQGEIHYAIQ